VDNRVLFDLTPPAFPRLRWYRQRQFRDRDLGKYKSAGHFLVLLTPTALERSADPKDWMRREIETAVESQRNVVPLMLAGFNFGAPATKEQLVGRMVALPEYNGLPIPEGYFPQAMERLRNKFLNVPVDAVLHPASDTAQQVARKQKDRARVALEEAAIEDGDQRSAPTGAPDQPLGEPPADRIDDQQNLRDGAGAKPPGRALAIEVRVDLVRPSLMGAEVKQVASARLGVPLALYKPGDVNVVIDHRNHFGISKMSSSGKSCVKRFRRRVRAR
jgi:hypothetical protein